MASGSTEMMMPVASVTIPAGGTVAFSPGGYHLMCMQPRMKPGDSIPVTFTFQNGATLDTQFKVVGATGRPPHSGS